MPSTGDNNYYEWKRQRQEVESRVKGSWVQDELPYHAKPHQYSKEDFYSQVSKANSLTKSEFEELFWKHLVKIGWRIDDQHIMLICDRCDLSLYAVTIKTINQAENTKVAYLKNPKKHLIKHDQECLEGESDAVQE